MKNRKQRREKKGWIERQKEKGLAKLNESVERYVDKQMLPATYRVYVKEAGFVKDGLIDCVHLSYDEWCARVLQEMKGENAQ